MINKDAVIKNQMELSDLIGCPGREYPVAHYIYNELKDHVDSIEIDKLGNVIAKQNGTKKDAKNILIDAHMDEIGFMVNHITDEGFLKVAALGGIDHLILAGTEIRFVTDDPAKDVLGVFCTIPPHLNTSNTAKGIVDLSIDIGAANKDEVLKAGINIGSVATFNTKCRMLNDKTLIGKAFDNRSGCNIAIQVARELSENKPENNIYYTFTIMEEYNLYGAYIASHNLDIDCALVVENTFATDLPGIAAEKHIAYLDKGVVIGVADKSHIVPKFLVDKLVKIAEDNKLPWQFKKPAYGGTNSPGIVKNGAGVPTCVIAVPCRYIHSPAGVLRVDDLMATVTLAYKFVTSF